MPTENYDRHIYFGLLLTLATTILVGLYWWGEPARMGASAEARRLARAERGTGLYASNCTPCHGANGEGAAGLGPALNTQAFLGAAEDMLVFDTIRDGRPNTAMPAWGQASGGPFTDEEIRDLAAFIRSWETTAPAAAAPSAVGDSAAGAVAFSTVCSICHGVNGEGTEVAPALNDRQRLAQFGDDWYRETIRQGRPSQGMPTWGRVFSPQQIDDLVAFIRAWQTTGPPAAPLEASGDPIRGAAIFTSTCIACHGPEGEGTDRGPALNDASLLAGLTDVELEAVISQGILEQGMPRWAQVLSSGEIRDLVAYIRSWEAPSVGSAPISGDRDQGAEVYAASCAACHGADGEGGLGPRLSPNEFVAQTEDDDLLAFLEAGRPGTPMAGFAGRLSDQELADLVALLRTWAR